MLFMEADMQAKAFEGSVAQAMALIILETVAEQGAEGAPSGIVYAALTGHLSYEQYTRIIGAFETAGLIRKSNHVLYYTGPALPAKSEP
jgi:hypothetical protein